MKHDMLDTMRNICDDNNTAARLIASGSLREAYRLLQDATKTACESLSFLQWESSSHGGNEIDDLEKTQEDQVLVSTFPVYQPELEETNVFLLPFFIQDPSMNEHNIRNKLPAICAVLICNMAISCHRFFYVARDCAKRQQSLLHAQQLYAESFELLQHLHLGGCLGQIFLGICNNMVEIAHEDGDLVNVQYWYGLLSEELGSSQTRCYDPALCRSAFRSVVYYSGVMVSARAA